MHIEARAYEGYNNFKTFGAIIDAEISELGNVLAYFQDQLQSIYFQKKTNSTIILQPDVFYNKIQPKLIELIVLVNGKHVAVGEKGLKTFSPVRLLSGKVLETGDIQWMIPITNGPIGDPQTDKAEYALDEIICTLENNPETKMSDELMYLQGFNPHFRYSGVIREVLNNLKQPLLALDIDTTGNYTIKLI